MRIGGWRSADRWPAECRLLGPQIVHLVLGGPIIGGAALSRFFALHVFVIPGAAAVALGGSSVAGAEVRRERAAGAGATRRSEDVRRRATKRNCTDGVPFLGDAMLKDVIVSALAVIVVVVIAAVVGPKGPTGPPDPTLGGANPRPEWPFLWLFALLSLSPPSRDVYHLGVSADPDCGIVAGAVRLESRRAGAEPAAGGGAGGHRDLHAAGHADLQGATSPWSPKMTAWSGDPIPERLVKTCRRHELMGAAVFQNKSCRNCHALDGIGGTRGPDLTDVGTRLTRDQLIDQISNGTPGGGNMPAYGKQIDPAEMATLVAFPDRTCGPTGQPPARDPPRPAAKTSACDGIRAMNPTLDAALRSWPREPWLLVALGAERRQSIVRGWLILRRRAPRRWHAGQLAAFCGGLATILPGVGFADRTVRVAAAAGPHGAARAADDGRAAAAVARRAAVSAAARPAGADPHVLDRAAVSQSADSAILHAADAPGRRACCYSRSRPGSGICRRRTNLPLRSPRWHYLQHVCFLGTGLLFWYPVVRPYPSRPRWSSWMLLPYLFLADVQNTLLSALLTFSGKLLYPYYAEVPRLGGISALADQSAAGVIMWVPGSIAFLVPLFWIGVRLLYGDRSCRQAQPSPQLARNPQRPRRCSQRSAAAVAAFDLLHLPLRRPHSEMAACAASPCKCRCFCSRRCVIADGFAARRSADEPGRRAAVDSLARAVDLVAVGGRQCVLHGLPVHAAADDRSALACRRTGIGRAGCGANGWPSACSGCFFGPTKRFRCGTARGGRLGSPSAISSRRL